MSADKARRIAVLGLWHQGVVGAACFAEAGYHVMAVDPEPERIQRLAQGHAPVFEPGLDELLQRGLASGHLQFSTDAAGAVRGCREVLLMQDTPVNERDESDLTPVFEIVKAVAGHLEPDAVLVVTAQVPVGTCDEITRLIRQVRPNGLPGIAYIPENLRLGQAIDRFRHPALPVIGVASEEHFRRVEQLLAPFGAPWQRVSLRTAEMTKHALNAFLAVSVCFGNELGNLCDEVGADGRRIAEVLRLEPRVGPKAMLTPGLGFSGGTLARDMHTLRVLGDRSGLDTPLLDGAWQSNQIQNRIVIRKLQQFFGALEGLPLAVLGLTYKPDTSTLRRSAALEIIAEMAQRRADVRAHDPRADRQELAQYQGFRFFENVYDALEGARVLVLMTGWPEYRQLAFDRVKQVMAQPVILDASSLLDGTQLTSMGFTYLDVGRGRTMCGDQ